VAWVYLLEAHVVFQCTSVRGDVFFCLFVFFFVFLVVFRTDATEGLGLTP